MMNDSSVDQHQEETTSVAAEVDANSFEDKEEEHVSQDVALPETLEEFGRPELIHLAEETEGVTGKDLPVEDAEEGNMQSENENAPSFFLEGSTDAESGLQMSVHSLYATDENATRASECAVVVPVDALHESTPVAESDTPVAKSPTAPSQETCQGSKETEGKTNHGTPPQRYSVRGQSDRSSHPFILTLPIDSLHCIASFLYPKEWTAFGQCGKGTGRLCREIFRRVRMHGFRCATEVVTAWVSCFLRVMHFY
jgi:hypothetical protein